LVNLFALRMSHSLFTTEEALIGTQGFSLEQILTPSNSQMKHFPICQNMKKSFFFKTGNSQEHGKNLEGTDTPLGSEALCLHLIESQTKRRKETKGLTLDAHFSEVSIL